MLCTHRTTQELLPNHIEPCRAWLEYQLISTLSSILGLRFWRFGKVGLLLIFVSGRFRGGLGLIVHGTLQLLNSDHLEVFLLVVFGMGFCWVRCEVSLYHGDGHLFGDCTFLLLAKIREHPEFHDLKEMDKSHWSRCLLWHGWLPLLSILTFPLGTIPTACTLVCPSNCQGVPVCPRDAQITGLAHHHSCKSSHCLHI